MNDEILKELKIVVEKAVRPIRATLARKRRMREELLAHLLAIYEEEVEKHGDARAALNQAGRRFGDPQELTGQLQQAVPRWDRFARFAEAGSFRGPRESLLHYACRIVGLAVWFGAVSIVVFLPIASVFGRESELGFRVRLLFCMSVMQIALVLGILLLTNGMYRALYRSPSNRSWRLATAYGLASMVFFPLLAFGLYWSLTGDLATSLPHLRFACLFAPLAPVLFALMSKQAVAQMRSYEEWASLEIEE